MEKMDIYNATKKVPDNAKKRINGGRLSGKTDINPMWRIKILTEQFGPCGIGWYYKTVNKWMEAHGDEVAAFVDIELYIKTDGEWSMPICGTGGNMFAEKEKSGIHVSDECYKMATTDAISVACKQLGIGADVYWESDNTKYSREEYGNGKTESKNKAPENGKVAMAAGSKNAASSGTVIREEDYPEHLRDIIRECNRTGISVAQVMEKYHLSRFEDMSELQHKSCMRVFSQVRDKEAS